MVVALGPGKFYGSSLPRPRIYTEVKLNDDGIRVDPPLSVMDPLLTWANDAHWSMGGLSFKRHRLQGRIEGNIKKLRAQQEKGFKRKKKQGMNKNPPSSIPLSSQQRSLLLSDDETDEELEEEIVSTPLRRSSARKLGDDFDKSASSDTAAVTSVTAMKGKFKGPSNDSPVSVDTNKIGTPKRSKNEINEPTTKSVPQSSPLTRRHRRALLLNDDNSEEVDEEKQESRGRLRKSRRSSVNEKTNSSSPLSATPDRVASRTRSRRPGEDSSPAGLRKSTRRL
ncbi:hypothetical protein NE237_005336 [Protea cynaroides]|uniref:Uncharacterized protein n=1 Tax=Protea cynaroides TaxID=273540 RepID=A0A9Q0QUH1_9MAGN|nr:hypothetical protein NE237_005336 [Protea cynaroides]